ncbi:hypothetical protein [Flavobacterium frigidarium]|uniref:hypothetical protein n=1 Tax=Flavobacterium frigidarium TaxID=99286 RepID=UPI00040B537F|nr:hypothetical protein [Flavobacterium frigidarium]
MKITIRYLIKFGEEQNIKKLFYQGEVFMNTIKSFKKSTRIAIGDKYEGTISLKNFNKGQLTLEKFGEPLNLKINKLQLLENSDDHLGNIFCSYALTDKLLVNKDKHTIDSRVNNFGSHCIIIKDVDKFLKAIFCQLDKNNIAYSHNLVKYHDYKKNDHILSLFDKSHHFSYQKEHRIIATTDSEKPIVLHIGSLEDYAEIHETEFLVKNSIFSK